MDPIRAALFRRDLDPCGRSRLAQSNGYATWAVPYLQPASEAAADAIKAAWLPVRAGQSVPMLGEAVGYVDEPCDRR